MLNTNKAVIYTRVSTKEQAENNKSLEIQKKYCLEYAIKYNLDVLGFFGGTYESAKSDERKEFNRMIKFVQNNKEGISKILVYSLDRFSRTGDNAIYISSQLKKCGTSIVSVTQPIDVSTHAGMLQQNIQFIFSKYDNDLRREKCIAGMREKILNGGWLGRAPVGYKFEYSTKEKKNIIAIDEVKGPLVRHAFELKSQGYSNTEVVVAIQRFGLQLNRKKLSDLIKNPFYCGYVINGHVEGTVINGKHEALVSEELFFKANAQLEHIHHGYKQEELNDNIPLKNFVRCGSCGTPLTGYAVKRKNLYYYKCNKIGCRLNRGVKLMHASFFEFLKRFEISNDVLPLLKEQLIHIHTKNLELNKEKKAVSVARQKELNEKLEKLEERYAYGEISEEVFKKFSLKIREQMEELRMVSGDQEKKLSNPSELISKALEICGNLSQLWLSASHTQKLQLQNLMFPTGVFYDREIEGYRTDDLNLIMKLTHSFSSQIEEIKKGQTKNNFSLSLSVVRTGIEPVLPE